MTNKGRDFGRKYVSDAEKEKKRKAKDKYIKTQKDAMHKFLKIENTLENERTEEMPGTSPQHSCEIVVKAQVKIRIFKIILVWNII